MKFFIVFLMGCIIYVVFSFYKAVTIEVLPATAQVTSVTINPITTIRGKSMKGFLEDGKDYPVDVIKTPEVGDIVAFVCNVEKCQYSKEIKHYAKFILAKKDDCFFMIGSVPESYDSKDYGWLCGDDLDFYGVILN